MTAEIGEEIGVEGDGLRRQNLFRRVEQDRLGLGLRLLLLLDRGGRGQRLLFQRLAVHLARGQARQGLAGLVARRGHIGRQTRAQFGAQDFGVESGAALRNQEGDQLVEPIILAQHHRRLFHAGEHGQLGLDLAQLDAEAANLHLVVDAAVEGNLAIGLHHHGVAGAIEDGIVPLGGEGILDEFLRRELVALEIAARHAGAADQQLAFDAALQKIVCVIGDVTGVIGDGAANAHRLVRVNLGHGGDNRGFGRAVGIENRPAGLAPARGDGRRAGLAAQNDHAQSLDVARQQRQQGRHGVEHGDADFLHHIGQSLGLAENLRRGDEKLGADQIGNPRSPPSTGRRRWRRPGTPRRNGRSGSSHWPSANNGKYCLA